MTKVKDSFKYIFLFCFFLSVFLFFRVNNTSYDVIWEYGFSHAIRIGEVPYLDFNTICTPLYIFLMSLGLFLWDNLLVYLIEQALLCTLLFYFLFKLLGKKAWLMLFILSFPLFQGFNGTYNFLAFFFLVVLIYLEREKKNDFYIGVVLGLLILSKHTIGIPALVLTLFPSQDIGKIIKRLLGAFVPISIFIIYLLVTNSFHSFLDLCFLGLFDFGSKNGRGLNFFCIISIVLCLLFIFCFVRKNAKNPIYYYPIAAFFFTIPLFDYYHVQLFVGILCLFLIPYITISKIQLQKLSICLTVTTLIVINVFQGELFSLEKLGKVSHFEYYAMTSDAKKNVLNVLNQYAKYPDAIMVSNQAMFFDIATDREITCFSVPLYGNYGYNGTNKMISQVKRLKNQIFFIEKLQYDKLLSTSEQLDTQLIQYIISHSERIDEVGNYYIYRKE